MSQTLVDQATYEVTCRKVAMLAVTGQSQTQIMAELGLTRGMLKKVLDDPICSKAIAEAGDEIAKAATTQIKKALGQMTTLALKALEGNLRDGNMEAVKVHFKAMGVLTEAPIAPQDTTIQVILPGQDGPTTIEVPTSKE